MIPGMITGMGGMLPGIVMLIAALAEITLPRPVIAAFAAVCLLNAALILINYRKKK